MSAMKLVNAESKISLTFEISLQELRVLRAFPDCCVSRAKDTPSARFLTKPLTKRAAAALRT
jgi:hypothetical protein